ncbi:MAG TPA: o-succinylbenzoate synthase [Candidatus Eisenbacteria bacterium]|nr:o-succinylbenzoate synthase [Candidatus Eisenbacteria bacterium]
MTTGAIARVRLGSYRFPFREPWPSSEGAQTAREGIFVVLEDDEGLLGAGESAPFPGFGMESLGSSLSALRLAARFALGLPAEHFLAAADDLPRLAPVVASPGARAALDLALHDLAARREGVTIARLLGGPGAATSVGANAVLPRLAAGAAAEAARAAVAAGARTVKLKVGGAPIAEDVDRVRAVREAVGPGIALRVDANQAWSESEAVEALRALAPLGLEYAEQPVPAGAIEAMARVRAAGGVAIAADESLADLRAARRLIGARAADVFVVKPMALGGLAASRAVIEIARNAGIGVTVTSLLESAVGRAGALHLAASLGAGEAGGAGRGDHGLATGGALAEDLVADFATRPGPIPLPSGAGLGDAIRDAALARTEPIRVEEPA